ncbi:Rieske (2Fe-2S) protein [Streptomyces sp. CA-251387]|uniref:Rieske (2Fe-2S) protein n=1 Tax=Streptomyces sp. CA-251387 TaxID=3240064 RepID=UPI003D9072B7
MSKSEGSPIIRTRLCGTSDILDGQLRVTDVGHNAVAVYRHDGEYYAVEGTCPHRGLRLEGSIVEQGTVICPSHFWRFDAASGQNVWPKTSQCLRRYSLIAEGDSLFLQLDRDGKPV